MYEKHLYNGVPSCVVNGGRSTSGLTSYLRRRSKVSKAFTFDIYILFICLSRLNLLATVELMWTYCFPTQSTPGEDIQHTVISCVGNFFFRALPPKVQRTFGTRLAAGAAGVSEHCTLVRLRGSTPDLKGLLPYTWPLDLQISSAL